MDSVLFKVLSTYYDTIFKSGYLPVDTIRKILVLEYLTELTNDPDYYLEATPCEQGIVKELYKCILENNCLLDESVYNI